MKQNDQLLLLSFSFIDDYVDYDYDYNYDDDDYDTTDYYVGLTNSDYVISLLHWSTGAWSAAGSYKNAYLRD